MVDQEKLNAFNSYDFEGNEEWKAHFRNVELPAGSAANTALLKVKAKWYKKYVDADFDPAWLPSSQNSTGTSTTYTPQQQQQQPQPSRSQASRPPSSTTGRGTSSQAGQPQLFSKQLNLAMLQAAILVLTILYLQPLKRGLSLWAYRRLTMTMIITQGYKIHGAHGWPAAWNKDAIMTWARRVLATSDAHYFILAVAAYVNPPVMALLVPYVILAAYGLAYFLSENFSSQPVWHKYGAQIYQKMLLQQQNALLINAQSEVMLGFQLIVGLLLPGRSPMLLLAVWQVLRLRYWSVDAAIHHRRVWAALDHMTGGIRQQFPILQKAVQFGANFFHAGRA